MGGAPQPRKLRSHPESPVSRSGDDASDQSAASKNSWTSLIAIAPSPTADATRVMDPWRTHPRRTPRAYSFRAPQRARQQLDLMLDGLRLARVGQRNA